MICKCIPTFSLIARAYFIYIYFECIVIVDLGTFVANQQLDLVIVQARTINEQRYGRFFLIESNVFISPSCTHNNVSLANKCMHDY